MFRVKHCREILLKVLYQIDVLKADEGEYEQFLDDYFNAFRRVNKDEEQFIRRLLRHIAQKRADIDRLISKNLIGWKLRRLNPIDRNLLRMGIAEAHFNDQKAIVIDDTIRLAKKYSEGDAYKFINAILDKVLP